MAGWVSVLCRAGVRNADAGLTAFRRLAADGHLPLVQVHEVLHKGESKPRAGYARGT